MAWGLLSGSGQSCLLTLPARPFVEGDVGETRGLAAGGPMCGPERPGGRAGEVQLGSGQDLGQEEPALGTAPPWPYPEAPARWQLLSFWTWLKLEATPQPSAPLTPSAPPSMGPGELSPLT